MQISFSSILGPCLTKYLCSEADELLRKRRLTYTQNCIVVELRIVGMNFVVVKEQQFRKPKAGTVKTFSLAPPSFGKKGGPLSLLPRAKFSSRKRLRFLGYSVAGQIASNVQQIFALKSPTTSCGFILGRFNYLDKTEVDRQPQNLLTLVPLTLQHKMAPSKPAADLNAMINAGQELRAFSSFADHCR